MFTLKRNKHPVFNKCSPLTSQNKISIPGSNSNPLRYIFNLISRPSHFIRTKLVYLELDTGITYIKSIVTYNKPP